MAGHMKSEAASGGAASGEALDDGLPARGVRLIFAWDFDGFNSCESLITIVNIFPRVGALNPLRRLN